MSTAKTRVWNPRTLLCCQLQPFAVNVVGACCYYHDNVRIPSGSRYLDYEESCSSRETENNSDRGLQSTIPLDDISKGSTLYSPDNECKVIGNGLEYWKGFYACSRPTQVGLSLILDTLTETFYEPILVSDFVFAYLGNRYISTPLPILDQIKIKRILKGVKIRNILMENKKNHVILDVVSALPLDQLLLGVQYYHCRKKYEINLKYPSLPALVVGNELNPVYFPMEFSSIVAGQRYTKKLNEKQRDAFSNISCDHPNNTKKSILKILEGFIAKDLGPHLNTTFTPIDARVLPPPTLEYLGAREIPKMGVWNMMDKKFVSGATVERWTCLSFSQVPLDTLTRFCNDLVSMCRDRGMEINPVPCIPIRCAQSDEIEEELQSIQREPAIKQAKGNGALKFVEFLIIILPKVNVGSYYARIKCNCDRNVISQCCELDRVYRYTNDILANMASKINVKAGGRNISIKYAMATMIPLVTSIPTIIFGAHINHPDPHDHSSPSIAGVVASMDWPDVTTYRASISEQFCKDETINDLYTSYFNPGSRNAGGGMIRELLVAFYNTTGQKPSRIIFYRDAVSNGQITEVLEKEIMAIRKGTIRPAHYHVLQDENQFPPDDLQSLTNILCYTYAIGIRAVSIVAPVKHAQLVASRGRCYIEGESSEAKPTCSEGGIKALSRRIRIVHLPRLNYYMQSRMFYC